MKISIAGLARATVWIAAFFLAGVVMVKLGFTLVASSADTTASKLCSA
nr:hypothetical protein [Sinorhizobium sp. M14]